jgi:hypothetical protein
LPNHRFTPRVEEVVARVGASLPFAEAADLLHGVGGVQVSEATQRRLTYAAGSAAVAVEETALARIAQQVPPVADAPRACRSAWMRPKCRWWAARGRTPSAA